MNNMELETDIEALDMEMGDITIHYCPVIPNPEGEPTAELKKANIEGTIYEFVDEEARTELENKVDKEEGKGLSENDFTDTLKDKLDGIEAEANKTIVDSTISSTSENPLQNKAIYNFLNDLLPEATETGNPISITNASGLNAKSLKVELEPVQDLNGYDSPWVGGGGKNKCRYPYTDGSSKSASGVTYTVDSKGIINVNATATANVDYYLFGGAGVYEDLGLPSGEYTFSLTADQYLTQAGLQFFLGDEDGLLFATNIVQAYSKNITIDSSKGYRLFLRVLSGTSISNHKIKIQIESGSTASAWSPYSNICPISGRTQTVVSVNSEDTTIQFGQTVYGGEVDVTSGGTSDEWGYITLDGTQLIAIKNWRPTSDSVGWIYPYNMTNNEISSSSSIVGQIIADKIKSVSYSALYNGGVGIAVYSSTSLGICIRTNDTSLTTESAINTFLSQNPITVCYKKATPTTISTPSNEISLLKGNNTLTADGDMELVYSKTPQ